MPIEIEVGDALKEKSLIPSNKYEFKQSQVGTFITLAMDAGKNNVINLNFNYGIQLQGLI